MINCVKLVSIPVKDQDRAIDFYVKKLGFTLLCDVPFGEGMQRWIELEIPGGETKISLFTPEGQEERIGSPSNISFSCKNVEETYEQLKKKGVLFTQELTREGWGTYALFSDPDGNVFCLSSEQ